MSKSLQENNGIFTHFIATGLSVPLTNINRNQWQSKSMDFDWEIMIGRFSVLGGYRKRPATWNGLLKKACTENYSCILLS